MASPTPPTVGRMAHSYGDGRLKHKYYYDPSTPRGFCAKYFSVKSCVLLAVVTVLLLVLPLVLPPLPPLPPTLLLLVPVMLLAMLLVLALAPPCHRNDAVDPAFYL